MAHSHRKHCRRPPTRRMRMARPSTSGRSTSPGAIRADRHRAQKAEPWRRYRARVRDGRVVPDSDIGANKISFVIETRWLSESDSADRRAVGCAIAAMLADAARRR